MFKECPVQRIEVITGEQKRRRYTPEEEARFVALAMLICSPLIHTNCY
jgi:transposase